MAANSINRYMIIALAFWVYPSDATDPAGIFNAAMNLVR